MRPIVKGCLQSRAAYIFYLFTLSKGTNDARSFLGYVLSTKLSFRILFSAATRALTSVTGGLRRTQSSCSVEGHHYMSFQLNARPSSSRKSLRGLGNLCFFFLRVNSGSDKIHKVLQPFSVVDVRGPQVFQAVRRAHVDNLLVVSPVNWHSCGQANVNNTSGMKSHRKR